MIAAERTLFVDERAADGGDGSKFSPYRRLQDALAGAQGAVVVDVATGMYEGPFELSADVTLRGRSDAVVLHAEGPHVVVARGGTLERLMIQGGLTGLLAQGAVTVRNVGFSGQRQTAVEVIQGAVQGSQLRFDASVSETVGLLLKPGATADISNSSWTGPFRRGVDQQGGTSQLRSVQFEDAVTAVHVRTGSSSVARASAKGGRGPAIIVNEADVTLSSVIISGHEYGVLVGKQGRLKARGLDIRNTERAGVASTAATLDLEAVSVQNGGSYGALQLTQSKVRLKKLKVSDASFAGVVINGGDVEVVDAQFDRIRNIDGSSGDGISVRTGRAKLKDIKVNGAEGAGVVCGNAAEVVLAGVAVNGALHGAFVADYKGKLTVRDAIASGAREAVFVAIEGASLSVDGARVETTMATAPPALLWVECATGSTMTLRGVKTTLPVPTSPCLQSDR